jgi:rod shape-determining protein MreD
MLASPRVRTGIVLLTVLLVHLSLLTRIDPGGIRPDALLLLGILAGVVAGAEAGAVVGFFAGLAADLFLQQPFGLSALAYTLVGFGVGSLQAGVLRATWWIPVATAFVASVVGVVLYALLGAMVGKTHLVQPRLLAIALVVGAMNAVISVGLIRLLTWALQPAGERRAYA